MSNQTSDRSYNLGEIGCEDLAQLAAAMVENPELAHEHLSRGYIQKWLEEDLRNYDAKIALDKLLEGPADFALWEFAARYAPDWEPKLYALPATKEFFDNWFPQLLKEDRISSFDDLHDFVHRLDLFGALLDERVTKGVT